jgi:BASS family bile acid:Na+ symporter
MMDIDSIRINFSHDLRFAMNLCLGFVMFGVAMNIAVDDFRRITKYPKSLLIGFTSQWLVFPIVTIYLIYLWTPALPASVALGLILVSSCPGGNMSNLLTTVAKGNAALSVSISAVVSLSSIILTPTIFILASYFVPAVQPLLKAIDPNPGEILMTFLSILVIPLILGMTCNHFFPKFINKIKKPVRILSVCIFISFIVFALSGNVENFKKYIHLVALLVIVHNMLGMGSGYLWSKWNRLPEADARAISIETGIQNSGFGLGVIFLLFPKLGGMQLVVAVWAVWDMVSGLLVASYWSWRAKYKTAAVIE